MTTLTRAQVLERLELPKDPEAPSRAPRLTASDRNRRIGHVHGYARRADGSWRCAADYRYWPSLGCGNDPYAAAAVQGASSLPQPRAYRRGTLIGTPLSIGQGGVPLISQALERDVIGT